MGDSEENHIRHTFDSFCEKVVRNENSNVERTTYNPYSKYKKILVNNKGHLFSLFKFSIVISGITISVCYQYIIDYFTSSNIKPDKLKLLRDLWDLGI
ncbi:hypothetical protein PF023_01705 [Enterococcus thailandicus]|uniref:hypothetical protein n=1 Tax=Enterococcus thailandicus TaxID=417368 RepID=UPI0022EBE700|nr:hypothetical protein [Enterococcus thailandicus]MDA3972747.1 hypothetical protein [Enterococcus thailandicus]MDA3975243.1 hypothetical protein [Enterococcus thailandicus]MDA3980207.1 hypothetical protein [Enterococcus thailandicus]